MTIPEFIQAAARLRAEEHKEHRRRALRFAFEARLVRRDPDPERRIAWLMSALGIDLDTAKRIDEGEDLWDSVPADRLCEVRPYKETDDMHDAIFLARAMRAAASVGRFIPAGAEGAGTFFMISPDLLMTNHHVMDTCAKAAEFQVEFGYEVDDQGEEREVTQFRLAPEQFFVSDQGLDYAVIALGEHIRGPGTKEKLGVSPLVTGDLHALGTFVNLIQHPGVRHKQIVFRENRVLCQPTMYLTYNADALDGSSGAPVYNDDWKVVGLHHSAIELGGIELCCGFQVPDVVNEGINIRFIVESLQGRLKDDSLTDAQRELLAQALRPQE